MATEVTSIGVGMETDGVERGIRTLQQLANQGPRVEKSMQGIEAAASKADKSLNGIGAGADKGLKAIAGSASGAEKGLSRVGKSAEETKRYIDNLHRSITGMGTIQTAPVARSFDTVKTSALDASKAVDLLKSTLAVTGIGIGVKEVINLADGYTKFTAQLKLASKSAEDYAASMTAVRRISLDAQQGLAETGTLYARIANGTAELGLSQQKLSDITETVALGLKVSGATASESASAMLQLSQAFASGVLRGEEFNAVNESAPRLMKALADGIGVPVGALRELASEGKITSQVMADALPKALESIRKEAEQIQTIGGSFTVLKNNLLEFVGAGDKASGATKAISTSITGLANNLDTIAVAAGGLALILAGRYVGAMAAAGAATATMAVSTVRANVAAVALATSISPAAAAVSAFGVAARGASAALALFGGPIGLAVTAIGAATAAFLYFRDTTEETIKSIGGLNQPLEDLKKKLDELPPEKRVSVIIDIEKSGREAIKQADRDIEALVQSVAGAANIKMPLDEFEKLTDSIRDTAKSGGDLTPILQKAAQSSSVPQSALQSWLDLAAGIREAQAAAGQAQAIANAAPKVEIMGPTIAQRDAQAQRDAAEALKGAAAYKSKAEQMAEVREQGNKLRVALANLIATNQGTLKSADDLRARIAGVDERLASMAKSGKSAAGGAKQVENAYSTLSKRVKDYIEQLRIEALQGDKATAAQRAQIQLNDLLERSKGKVTAAKVAGLQTDIQTALLMEKEAKAIKLAADQAEEAAKAYEAVLDSSRSRTESIYKQVQAEDEAAQAIGMTREALNELVVAKLEDKAATLESRAAYLDTVDWSKRAGDELRNEAKAWRDLAASKTKRAVRQATYDTSQQAAKDWEKVSKTIGDTLADYIMGGGKDAAQYLKRLFSTLVLQPVVQTAVGSIFGGAGGAQAMLGGGNGGFLGTASNLNSLYGAFSGGITSSIGGAIGGLGSMLGSSALTSFAAGIKGSTLAAGLAGPTTAGASGAMGLGASFGAALPWLAGGLAIASLFGGDLFKKSTPHMGAAAVYKGGEVSRGWMPEGQFQEEMFTAIGGIAQSIGSALDATAESFGKKAGYTLSTVFSDDSSKDKAFGGLSIIGPDGQKIADWSGFDQKWGGKRFSDGEAGYKEYLAALTGDVKTAFMAMDLPGWSDQLIEAATDLDSLNQALQGVSSIKASFDALGRSMEMFSGISGELQTVLLETAGSMDTLLAGANAFYQGFYSEQERMEALQKQLRDTLTGLDLSIDPAMGDEAKEQFRAAVEAAMAGGQGELASQLLAMSGSFATAADAAQEMADAAADLAQNLRSSLISIESQFSGGGFSRQYQAEGAASQLQSLLFGAGISKDAGTLTQTLLSATTDEVESYFREIWGVLDTDEARLQLVNITGAMLDLAAASDAAAQAAADAAAAIASERAGLEQRWLQAIGDTAELRRRELDALDPSNRALLEMIFGLEDAQKSMSDLANASQQAAQKAAAAWQNWGTAAGLGATYLGDTSGLEMRRSILNAQISSSQDPADRLGKLQELISIEQAIAQAQQKSRATEIDAIKIRQQALQAEISSAKELLSAAKSLGDYAKSLQYSEASGLSDIDRLSALGGQYSSLMAKARGGDSNAINQLQGVSSDYLGLSKTLAISGSDYAVQAGRMAAEMEAMAKAQELTAQSQVTGYEAQIAKLTQQAELLYAQVELSDSTKGLIAKSMIDQAEIWDRENTQALTLQELQSRAADSLSAMPENVAKALRPTLNSNASYIASSVGGAVSAAIAELAKMLGIDGSHASGLSYVPFDGYRAELHKGERVLTAQQNQAYSSGLPFVTPVRSAENKELVEEVRALRQQNALLVEMMGAIKQNTGQFAEQFDNVTAGGNAMATEVMG